MKVLDSFEYGYVHVLPLEHSTVDFCGIEVTKHSLPQVCLVEIMSGEFKGKYALAHGVRMLKFNEIYLLPKADFIQTVELEEGKDFVSEFKMVKQNVEEFVNAFRREG